MCLQPWERVTSPVQALHSVHIENEEVMESKPYGIKVGSADFRFDCTVTLTNAVLTYYFHVALFRRTSMTHSTWTPMICTWTCRKDKWIMSHLQHTHHLHPICPTVDTWWIG